MKSSTILQYQQGMDTKATEKISIGGLRFSSEQTQVSLSEFSADFSDFTSFLEKLAQDQISLPFLCIDTMLGAHASICMSREDFEQQRDQVSDTLQRYDLSPKLRNSTGSLTLFPHQSRLKILGAVLEIFGKQKLPIHSLCSSISALVVNTDYHELNNAAQALETVFHLPDNHSPFRPPTKCNDIVNETVDSDHTTVVETAAVYWEPVIKIYGSCVKIDLHMTSVHVAEHQLCLLGSQLQDVDSGRGVFEMAVIQRIDDKTYKLGLLHESTLMETYRTFFSSSDTLFSDLEQRPAELLYLYGPHFHDRYGVASAAFRSLQKNQNELFAVGCAGTSIYLITPRKKAQLSADALEKIFIVPRLS